MNCQQLATDITSAYIPPETGRPSAIGDQETVFQFLNAIHDGNYIETACELADISRETYRQWTKRAEDGEPPYVALIGAAKRASAIAEAMEVSKVRKAGADPRFWAASMTYLERRHPERWARRSEGNDGPKVVVQIGVRDADVQVCIASSASATDRAIEAPLQLGQGAIDADR
jgi:hypothetical protein